MKFVVVVDATASGNKTIASKYSFVNNNTKEVIEMTPAEITIGEGTSADGKYFDPSSSRTRYMEIQINGVIVDG